VLDGFGGWVPEVAEVAEPLDEPAGASAPSPDPETDPLAGWAPPVGRHRRSEPEPAPPVVENMDTAPNVAPPIGPIGLLEPAEPAELMEPAEPAEPAGPSLRTADDEEASAEPTRARRHRINGRWGRFAELWVPEPLRNARLDPGRRGMVVLVLVAAIAAVATAFGVWRDRPEPRPIETSTVAALSAGAASPAGMAVTTTPTTFDAAPAATQIVVSVTGLVASPGVVRLPADSRVADAIAAAGGAQPGANLTGINLAAKLADGDSVVVTDTPAPAGDRTATAQGSGAAGAGPAGPQPSGVVNLNTADEAALDTLPGVGPVMAQNIVAWREANGKFTSIEQLQEISGIGPSRYAQIAGLVTVG